MASIGGASNPQWFPLGKKMSFEHFAKAPSPFQGHANRVFDETDNAPQICVAFEWVFGTPRMALAEKDDMIADPLSKELASYANLGLQKDNQNITSKGLTKSAGKENSNVSYINRGFFERPQSTGETNKHSGMLSNSNNKVSPRKEQQMQRATNSISEVGKITTIGRKEDQSDEIINKMESKDAMPFLV